MRVSTRVLADDLPRKVLNCRGDAASFPRQDPRILERIAGLRKTRIVSELLDRDKFTHRLTIENNVYNKIYLLDVQNRASRCCRRHCDP